MLTRLVISYVGLTDMPTAMGDTRVRIKFGEHEFEAAGSEESVDRHLAFFKQLIAPPGIEAIALPEAERPLPLEQILRLNGKIVSLSVTAKVEDAILVLLLGLAQLCQKSIVSGAEIMMGLRQSGFRLRRADVLLRKHEVKGNIIAIGRHRSRRYQFSKKGKEQAQQIARGLISRIPSQNAEGRQAT